MEVKGSRKRKGIEPVGRNKEAWRSSHALLAFLERGEKSKISTVPKKTLSSPQQIVTKRRSSEENQENKEGLKSGETRENDKRLKSGTVKEGFVRREVLRLMEKRKNQLF